MPTIDELERARLRLAETLDQLQPDQWELPTGCSGWSVRDVVAHLVAGPTGGVGGIAAAMAMSGFSIARANQRTARRFALLSPEELVDSLRGVAGNSFAPPGLGLTAPMSDVVIHTLDICDAIGATPRLETAWLRCALDAGVSWRFRIVNPKVHKTGLRFETTDLDWSWGSGTTMRGEATEIAPVVWGRPIGGVDRSVLHGEHHPTTRTENPVKQLD